MTDRIVEIREGIARVIDQTVVASGALPDIVKHLQTRVPTIFPVLPDHTRLIAFDPDNNRGRLIVQTPPEIVGFRVHFDNVYNRMPKEDRAKADRNGYYTFQLQFPWAIHYFGFIVETGRTERAKEGYGKVHHEELQGFLIDETGYYWSDKPITSMDQFIFPAQMLNINHKGGICWGSTTGPTQTLAERLDALVKNFYATQYNDHYGYRCPPAYKSYSEWEADKDPLSYLQWPMWDINANPEGITVGRRLQVYMDQSTVHAEGNIAAPPTRFTIGKMMEWFKAMPDNERTRFLSAAKALSAEADVQSVLDSLDWSSAGKIKIEKKKAEKNEASFA